VKRRSKSSDPCLARTLYRIALNPKVPPVYFGAEAEEGICPGGRAWCGMTTPPSTIKYFVSTGKPDFMGRAAEYLKPDPGAAERLSAAPGKITFRSKYINTAGWDQLEDDQEVSSFVLIGNAESIKNLGGLVQYAFETS